MCSGAFCRLDHVFFGSSRTSIGDIFINRTGEQIYILLHDTDIAPQALQRKMLDILTVQQDLSFRDIIESGDQIAQCRLSSTGGSDDRHLFPRMDLQVQIRKYLIVIIRIFEAYFFKRDFSLRVFQFDRIRFVKDLDIRIHDL